uniref:Filamin C n=1 Tax=Romanomermis culicivorax TaxID=13658 RepID=A0A915KN90_ROMCU
SPFQFHVDQVKDGYVTAYGPGLTYGSIGEPCTFTVCVKDAGAGGLSVLVDGPAKAEIQCHDNKDGTCSVSWLPPVPGEYKIVVKFADKEIKGSPFVVRIAGESRKRAHISLGSTSEVALKITEPDLKGMSSSIKSPSGIEEPCSMRILHDGHLGISFTPREIGEHLVTVKKRNVLLPGAPFRISVGDSEVGNASKVKLSGAGLEVAHTQEFNEFVVDTQKAGFGGLSVSVEGPSKSEIVCKENKDGICKIHYKPTEPGIYVLSVKFADHHVPGKP